MAQYRLIAALCVVVALAHGWLLHHLREQFWQMTKTPAPLVAPMLTRLLQPAAPVVLAVPQARKRSTRAKPSSANPGASSSTHSSADPGSDYAASVPAALDSPSSPAAQAAREAEAEPEPVPDEQTAHTAPAAEPQTPPEPAVAEATASPAERWGTWPSDTRIRYQLSGRFHGELFGSAQVLWQRQAQRYQVQVLLKPFPFVSYSFNSQGVVGEQGLGPQHYWEQLSRKREVVFDDTLLRLQNGQQLPRPPEVQDTASQFVQLAQRFATGQDKLEAGASVKLWLARPAGVDLWTYDIGPPETLQTRFYGALLAYPLTPRPLANPRGTISAKIWFAPTLQYLPVRVRVSLDEGTYVDLLVDKIEQAEGSPSAQLGRVLQTPNAPSADSGR